MDALLGQTLHVHDLPQVYTKPSTQAFVRALELLQRTTSNFEGPNNPVGSNEETNEYYTPVDVSGLPRYLTGIISSSLDWLPEEDRETIWEIASQRLCERAGRSAAPSMDRSFRINDDLVLTLHEPSLTEDNLGLKTWTSSLLLARRLHTLSKHIPTTPSRMLELGSGTGLVGIAAACLWQNLVTEVMLTDLPEIVPNLQKNIDRNAYLWSEVSPSLKVHSRVLDWSENQDVPVPVAEKFPIIVAADPIYSADHPQMLVETVRRWLAAETTSRFIVELPIRDGYSEEREDLRRRLEETMVIVEEGQEVGYDDWEGADGRPAEVTCWWSVWKSKT